MKYVSAPTLLRRLNRLADELDASAETIGVAGTLRADGVREAIKVILGQKDISAKRVATDKLLPHEKRAADIQAMRREVFRLLGLAKTERNQKAFDVAAGQMVLDGANISIGRLRSLVWTYYSDPDFHSELMRHRETGEAK